MDVGVRPDPRLQAMFAEQQPSAATAATTSLPRKPPPHIAPTESAKALRAQVAQVPSTQHPVFTVGMPQLVRGSHSPSVPPFRMPCLVRGGNGAASSGAAVAAAQPVAAVRKAKRSKAPAVVNRPPAMSWHYIGHKSADTDGDHDACASVWESAGRCAPPAEATPLLCLLLA